MVSVMDLPVATQLERAAAFSLTGAPTAIAASGLTYVGLGSEVSGGETSCSKVISKTRTTATLFGPSA